MGPALSFALMLFACVQQGLAADYAREERWAQEIATAVVVGDVVYLSTAARPRVLAILTAPSGAAKGVKVATARAANAASHALSSI